MGKKSRRRKTKDTADTTQNQESNREISQVPSSEDLIEAALKSPYVIARGDFRNLPRWPSDGIEKGPFEAGEREKCKSFDVNSDDPEHIALVKLLGGYWPFESPLNELPLQQQDFIRGLPSSMQLEAAKEQSDITSAIDHIITAYKQKDPKVKLLLKAINCSKAVYKATYDKSRFPDVRYIIVPLFQRNLASDSNVKALFGKVSSVRHILLEVGFQVAEPPPPNSPASAFLSQFLYDPDLKAAPGPKSCPECGSVSEDKVKCSACKTVHYCNRDCQRKHWPIHKPDCLKAQGKDVPKSAIEKAERAMAKKAEREQELEGQKKQQLEEDFWKRYQQFVEEPASLIDSWAHDCMGKRLRIYAPTVNADNMIVYAGLLVAGLQLVQKLCFVAGIYPDGIDGDKYGYRGLELKDSENGARIIVLFERLFEENGEGAGCGLHIDGVFVVNKAVRNRARWKLVSEPLASYSANNNRSDRLVKYLQMAKEKAKPVPETVDLGILNQGDPMQTITSTPCGDYTEVHGFQTGTSLQGSLCTFRDFRQKGT